MRQAYIGVSLQSPEQRKLLVQELKPILGSLYKAVHARFAYLQQRNFDYKQQLTSHITFTHSLNEDYVFSEKMAAAYQAWKANVGSISGNYEDEFCRQTAYMHFVRIFLVRACENYRFLAHCISNEFLAGHKQPCNELSGDGKGTYLKLLEAAYQEICVVYPHFLVLWECFDWFVPDENTIMRLFTLLERYDFKGLSVDVLGSVYNESFIESRARSEKGQFYTPPEVVEYMLASLGIPTYSDWGYMKDNGFLEKTIGDLSCGSGSFLVAVAARKSAFLQELVAAREVSSEDALAILSGTLWGFDLNSFACYLAEINLLIACLPFLIDEQGQFCRSVKRFHTYCMDVLEPTAMQQVRMPPNGFDYLLGNPPYVSAAEGADNLRYRDKVWHSRIYQLLHQRWDLFIPFFERNLQFLRSGTGRLGLIVSNGIETEGYAERLRQALSSHYRLLQIDFFPGLLLFQDAAIENTIVLLEHCAPDVDHEVVRRKHLQADCRHFETLPSAPQLASNGQVFRWRYDPILYKSVAEGSIPLCAIVYIGTGIEAQSNEYRDPIIDGKRQKRFTLDDVFLLASIGATRPVEYTDDGVLGNDVEYYHLSRKRYVAYEKFQPYMRGPRHIALFRTAEKLLLGETSGGYYDREGLFANHSVQVVVPWKDLEYTGAIEQKGISAVLRTSQQISGVSGKFAPVAELFDLRYLLGIINSRFMRRYIALNMHEGTRAGRVYPNVWKRLPIKVASLERQQQIATLVDAVQERYRQLATLQGVEEQELRWSIDTLLSQIETLVEATYRESADTELLTIINAKMAQDR